MLMSEQYSIVSADTVLSNPRSSIVPIASRCDGHCEENILPEDETPDTERFGVELESKKTRSVSDPVG